MAGNGIAVSAAHNFRSLRKRGVTVRKTIDLLIGTWCIENRRPLLHNDSDFYPMTRQSRTRRHRTMCDVLRYCATRNRRQIFCSSWAIQRRSPWRLMDQFRDPT
ncbi:hypothetical protein [Bradyrhizobium sp.]|uniref:hypothetical protein n=1 Tax=Bradyrhizobium sp. TaxID=376 RepID=UPI00261AA2C6|nr:hypothetical protein [Bradyrhizobium sp.]